MPLLLFDANEHPRILEYARFARSDSHRIMVDCRGETFRRTASRGKIGNRMESRRFHWLDSFVSAVGLLPLLEPTKHEKTLQKFANYQELWDGACDF